ncbi:MAG: TrkH family potassium uptake protein [Bacilli bacterium]|nr:TrkH family potassium uptake protein [Bacilli bacterium]
MNYRFILKTLGHLLLIEAILMFLPLGVSIYKNENIIPFVNTIVIILIFGSILSLIKIKNKSYFAKEGLMITTLSWISLSLFGALPFYFSGYFPTYIDAFFETVSGFTTTGSTILKNIEVLPYGLLFWRSFTHWIGGMGILVFAIAILPLSNENSMHMIKAEVPGPFTSKLVPKLKDTAKWLYGIYLLLTILEILLLLLGGMPLFDSIVTSFATAGTGGFAIKNSSIAFYNSTYIDYVISIFMILFGINFNIFFLIIMKKFKQAISNEEMKAYFGIIITSTILITLNILSICNNIFEAFRLSFFQVSSIITTTGFATTNFDLWPQFSKIILLFLMFCGACGGSTGGGIKVSRIVIALKKVIKDFITVIHPNTIKAVRLDKKVVNEKTINDVGYYLVLYFLIIIFATLIVSLDNFDFETTLTSVITCISNVGPGFSIVGPIGNFADFSGLSKLVLSIVMLFGRLELYPMLLLFYPLTYIKNKRKQV